MTIHCRNCKESWEPRNLGYNEAREVMLANHFQRCPACVEIDGPLGVCACCGHPSPGSTLCWKCSAWAVAAVWQSPQRITVAPGMLRPEALGVLEAARAEAWPDEVVDHA
jgi:hypothetical protein